MSDRIWCLPILAGALRGYRWAPASGGKLARLYMGTYEREQTQLMQQSFGADSMLLDIGANHGYYSLLAARLSAGAARVLAFEPNPHCLRFLRHHVQANRLEHVSVIAAAVGGASGTAWFEDGSGTATGHLAAGGTQQVQVVTVDETVATYGVAPTHLKIDVEGSELEVLQGAVETLQRFRPEIFLSTHGAEIHANCCQFLADVGYQLAPIRGSCLETTPEVHGLAQTTNILTAA